MISEVRKLTLFIKELNTIFGPSLAYAKVEHKICLYAEKTCLLTPTFCSTVQFKLQRPTNIQIILCKCAHEINFKTNLVYYVFKKQKCSFKIKYIAILYKYWVLWVAWLKFTLQAQGGLKPYYALKKKATGNSMNFNVTASLLGHIMVLR